jgi:hypothetical protein
MRPSFGSHIRRAVGHGLLFLLVAFAGRTASAAPTLADKAAAEALFEDGLKLMGDKRYAEACPKLEESERLDPAMGTRFRLSECEEAVGRLASAWAGFLEVADLAHNSGQADREGVARTRAAAIEPNLSRLEVDVAQPDTPGLKIKRENVTVGRGQWGTPVPIDAGTYSFTATAPGKTAWKQTVTVDANGASAKLMVPALEDVPPSPPPPVAPPAVVIPPPAPPPVQHSVSSARIGGFALVGAGAGTIVASGVMGLVATIEYHGAPCGATSCGSTSGKNTIDDARSLGNVATAVFVVGAVAAAAGGVVVVVAPRWKANPSSSTALRVGLGSAFLEGGF